MSLPLRLVTDILEESAYHVILHESNRRIRRLSLERRMCAVTSCQTKSRQYPCTAFAPVSPSAIDRMMDPPDSTIEKAGKAARNAHEEYRNALNWSKLKSDHQTVHILPAVGSALERICDQLDCIADNEDICLRLENISLGGLEHQVKLMDGLHSDLESIHKFLENARRGVVAVGETDVNAYARALERYVEVLKAAQKRNMRSVRPNILLYTPLSAV
jgi:hypothetical protein